jgi:putative Mg2+ transporter-C (MgtC) family protein
MDAPHPTVGLCIGLAMSLHLTGSDILLRLALAFVAGAIIGLNRETQGHAAGLRTTVLVALAAAVAMILANLLLSVDGKTPGSFATLDPMRLPLGILTGVGFIGGGAILKQGGSVSGVTTAATLWIVTVIGLCFGSGQIGLGVAATLLGIATLFGMKWIDLHIPRRREGHLTVMTEAGAPAPDLSGLLSPLRCRTRFVGQRTADLHRTEYQYVLHWAQTEVGDRSAAILAALRGFEIRSFRIKSEGDI